MSGASKSVRPGLARADRRELSVIREWLSRLDEEPLRAALAALLAVDGASDARERLATIASTLGIEPPTISADELDPVAPDPFFGWTAFRTPEGLVLRFTGSDDDSFELQIFGDTVRIVTATTGDGGGASEPPSPLEDALDASAGPVLRWLRGSGDRPAQASRLAALYAPRLRGSSWPSSLR